MEKKQNVKPITIEDQIEVLWKENPRIPFLQSKEILTFGYKQGIESVTSTLSSALKQANEVLNQPAKTQNEGSFTGTTKEFFEHTEKEIQKRKQFDTKDEPKTVYIKATELELEEARFKLLDELYNFITEQRDLMETYTKIRNMRNLSQSQVKALKKRINK